MKPHRPSCNTGTSIVGFCVMGGDGEAQCEAGKAVRESGRDSSTADSTQLDRGGERERDRLGNLCRCNLWRCEGEEERQRDGS